jgi:hypothetical protein
MARGRPSRPAHQITVREVDAWLAASAVTTPTFHRTDQASARDIVDRGVDLRRARDDSAWGRGFYSSDPADPQHGSAEVRVAVRLRHPLVIRDTVRDAELMDELLARAGTDDVREALLDAGYDGVVLHYPLWGLWVVAYRADQVRVAIDDDQRRA